VYETGAGQYLLRIGDLKFRPLIVEVSKHLPGATSLIVVTPKDTKVFTVSSNGTVSEPEPEPIESEPELDEETKEAIAQQEELPIPGEAEDIKPVRRRTRKSTEIAGHPEPCGRCSGSGQTRIILPDGKPSDTACPVCKGEGTIQRYGNRR